MFASREDAGRQLAEYLKREGIEADAVLGLPRGGVVVAAEVAREFGLPLDVVVVRKIGHPLHREFAVGALAEGDVVVLDENVIGRNPIILGELEEVIEEEKERLEAYRERFHHAASLPLEGRRVLLIDDGLATGATTEAAVLSARKQGAHIIIVAAPVASMNAMERLLKVADDVRAVEVDPEFEAVGRYYEVFTQTTDEEVLDCLNHASHL